MAVGAFDNERHVFIFLDICKFLTELGSEIREHGLQLQITVIADYTIEHGLIHQTQYLVLGSLGTLLDTLHSRFQRVGRNQTHHLSRIQFSLQKLSVGLLFLGFGHNLL